MVSTGDIGDNLIPPYGPHLNNKSIRVGESQTTRAGAMDGSIGVVPLRDLGPGPVPTTDRSYRLVSPNQDDPFGLDPLIAKLGPFKWRSEPSTNHDTVVGLAGKNRSNDITGSSSSKEKISRHTLQRSKWFGPDLHSENSTEELQELIIATTVDRAIEGNSSWGNQDHKANRLLMKQKIPVTPLSVRSVSLQPSENGGRTQTKAGSEASMDNSSSFHVPTSESLLGRSDERMGWFLKVHKEIVNPLVDDQLEEDGRCTAIVKKLEHLGTLEDNEEMLLHIPELEVSVAFGAPKAADLTKIQCIEHTAGLECCMTIQFVLQKQGWEWMPGGEMESPTGLDSHRMVVVLPENRPSPLSRSRVSSRYPDESGRGVTFGDIESSDPSPISKWVLDKVAVFGEFVGLSYVGHEEEVMALFRSLEHNKGFGGGRASPSKNGQSNKRLVNELRRLSTSVQFSQSQIKRMTAIIAFNLHLHMKDAVPPFLELSISGDWKVGMDLSLCGRRAKESMTVRRKKKNLKIIAGSCYLPKDDELKPRGEDAHFIHKLQRVIGVADGVGGWAKRGVDSGEYSRELMYNSIVAIHKEPYGFVDPERVLEAAYSNTKVEGSSTACIVAFTNKFLHAVNVGDSRFMVIREDRIIYCSPVQLHRFNCPYQLGSGSKCDPPSSAQVLKVPIEVGDIVVAGTDGLFDNLFKHEIADMVIQGMRDGMEPGDVASVIAEHALDASNQKYCLTPFAEASKKAGLEHIGGKYDDITVIVACIGMPEEYYIDHLC
ncbi:hypothetical protein HHK36_014540 [Tetracentron sinense]|uniref:Protein phosphatase n=1 Tax=Tetracentron sinense TaxID=13715 RepID=A0A834Z3L1_TETSI|nr:hypothetical protein HHK36_014540 [Tetracentron sinense]